MATRRPATALVAALAPAFLPGCTKLIGPLVVAAPSAGKTPAAFGADRSSCMALTSRNLQPVMNVMNHTPRGIEANNAVVQGRFDAEYEVCMASRGDTLPMAARARADSSALTAPVASPARETLDGSNSSSLSDTASADAKRFIASRVRELVQACEGDHLVARSGHGWATLLAAEPGSIAILPAVHDRYRAAELRFLSFCVHAHRWKGRTYAMAAARDCAFDIPPDCGDVARKIRGR